MGGDLPHPHDGNQAKKARGVSHPKHGTSIPKGDTLLRGVSTEDLRKMQAELPGCKEVNKEALILAVAIKWR